MDKQLMLRALQCYKDQLWKGLRINRFCDELEEEYINVCHAMDDLEVEEVPDKIELPIRKASKGLLDYIIVNDEK